MDRQLSVVVIDDHPAIVAGVVAWCAQAEPAITVLAAGEDISLAWTQPGGSAAVVVLDLHLGSPRPAYDELRRLASGGRSVVVYSQHTDHQVARECLELGAETYLTKAEGGEYLIPAIVAASRHLPYVPPSLSGAIAGDPASDRPQLSEREREALTAWFESSSKRLAAARLNVSPDTLKTFIERARLKYAAAGRPAPTKAALLERAYQDGLIDWRSPG